MADLSEIQGSDSTKIAGANASGVETNYLAVDANQNLGSVIKDGTGTEQKVNARQRIVFLSSWPPINRRCQ